MKERNKRNTAAAGRETGRRLGSREEGFREEGFREGRSGFRKVGFGNRQNERIMPALPILLLAAVVLVVIFVAALWNRSSTPETIQGDEIWSETIPGDGSSSEGASKETAEGWEEIPESQKAENKISGGSDSDAESTGLPIMTGESAAASKKDGAAASGNSGNTAAAGNGLATGNSATVGTGLAAGNTAASGSDSVAGNSVASGNDSMAGNTVTSGSTGAGGTGVTGSSGSTSGTGTSGTTVQPGENKNPVREPGNVVVEEGGNASFHQRDSESVELPFDFVDE